MPHCQVGTAHEDLQAEKCRLARRARLPPPGPSAPAWPAVAHLRLTASAPAQGFHRLLAPGLSCCREVRRPFALKVHPCETQASVAWGRELATTPLPDARSCHTPFRIPVSEPTHTWFQRVPTAAIAEPGSTQPHFRRSVCVTSASRIGSGPKPFLGV